MFTGRTFAILVWLIQRITNADSVGVATFDPWADLSVNLPASWGLGSSGALEGNLFCYGDGNMVDGISAPLLIGDDGDTVAAVAQLGQGRLAVFSHTSFTSGFQGNGHSNAEVAQLQTNLRSWLTNGTYTSTSEICTANSVTSATECINDASTKIIEIGHWGFDTSTVDTAMIYWVKNGGGIISAVTPWAFHYYTVADFSKISYAQVYHAAGIGFGTGTSKDPYKSITSQTDKDNYRKHNLGYVVDIIQSLADLQANADILSSNTWVLAVDESRTPKYIKDKLLAKYLPLYTTYSDPLKTPTGSGVSNTGLNGFLIKLASALSMSHLAGQAGLLRLPNTLWFPGDMDTTNAVLTNETVTVTSHKWNWYHPLCLYHIGGRGLNVKVTSPGEDYKKWTLQVGTAKDDLLSKSSLERWPRTVIYQKLNSREITIPNVPFGGLIYLRSPEDQNSSITLELAEVLKSPCFTETTTESEFAAMLPGLDCRSFTTAIGYRGTLDKTVSNRTCQRWDSQSPHRQSRGGWMDNATLHENYCRNPGFDESKGLWCYTTDPGDRWDWCTNPSLCETVPWIDVIRRNIIFSVPRYALAGHTYTQIKKSMQDWDEATENNYILRGSNQRDDWLQVFVADQQPSAGYMHAGYPIVTHLDIADTGDSAHIFKGVYDGMWGHFHEIGHNLQKWYWTLSTGGEVTNNIYTLYNMDKMAGQAPINSVWIGNRWSSVADSMAVVPQAQRNDAWDNSGAGAQLVLYAQLQITFGWNCYMKVFAYYENTSNPDNRPSGGDQAERDAWVKIWSQTVGLNLCPMFEFWGWKVNICASLSALTPFMPDDKTLTSTVAKDEANRIAALYNNTIRDVTPLLPLCV